MLTIKRIAHSAILIQTQQKSLYFDPFKLTDRTQDADVIFVSHERYDHYSPKDIEKITKKDTILIAPKAVIALAKEQGMQFKEMLEVSQSGDYQVMGMSFKTVPAYNPEKPYHPRKNGGVGYILFSEGETVYFAGDTDITDELLAVYCTIALLPIGGTYTMDAQEAAKAANIIKPREVIPMHYTELDSTCNGLADAAAYFEALLLPDIKCTII